MTLRTALNEAIARLEAAGVETPRLDAELLLAHALGKDRTYLFAHGPDPLPRPVEPRFRELVERRAGREPLPYIVGTWEWLGMSFRVTPAVLIPRPETETLVEEVAERLAPGARVLDVGAGSGCIGIGLAALRPDLRVTELELSPEAAAVARENVLRLRVEDRVSVVEGRFPETLPSLGCFEAVVSNPPYIPSAEVDQLPPELRRHEPRLALDGGPEGLDVLRNLASAAPTVLEPGGMLAVEVAAGQAPRFVELLRAHDRWREPEVIRDLAGVERIVLAYLA